MGLMRMLLSIESLRLTLLYLTLAALSVFSRFPTHVRIGSSLAMSNPPGPLLLTTSGRTRATAHGSVCIQNELRSVCPAKELDRLVLNRSAQFQICMSYRV